MNLLEIKNIRKSYGDLEVLKNISLSVGEGDVVRRDGARPGGAGEPGPVDRRGATGLDRG